MLEYWTSIEFAVILLHKKEHEDFLTNYAGSQESTEKSWNNAAWAEARTLFHALGVWNAYQQTLSSQKKIEDTPTFTIPSIASPRKKTTP